MDSVIFFRTLIRLGGGLHLKETGATIAHGIHRFHALKAIKSGICF